MAANEEKRMIVGLDIGTSKVVAVVGEIDADGTIDIVGIGIPPDNLTLHRPLPLTNWLSRCSVLLTLSRFLCCTACIFRSSGAIES